MEIDAPDVSRRKSAYPMVPMPEAIAAVRQCSEPENRAAKTSFSITLSDSQATGHILSEDVLAPCDIPVRPCSRLDGFAVHAADGPGVYPIVQVRRAGHAADAGPAQLPRGAVAYITTGASLPAGADAIVKVEDTADVSAEEAATAAATAAAAGATAASAAKTGVAEEATPRTTSALAGVKGYVRILPSGVPVPVGEGVRLPASDVRAGTTLLPVGHVLTPLDVGTLQSARVQAVRVWRPLVVGVLSTGDELRSPTHASSSSSSSSSSSHARTVVRDVGPQGVGVGFGHEPRQGQGEEPNEHAAEDDDYVVDSNRPMLMALLRDSLGIQGSAGSAAGPRVTVKDLGAVRDSLHATVEVLRQAAQTCDIVISTGAVSMGDRDYVKPALEQLGRVVFGRLNMKPGKPTTMAVVQRAGVGGGSTASASEHSQAQAAHAGSCLFFGLPGNPVSAAVCFHILVAPSVRHMSGVPWHSCTPPCVTVTLQEPAGLPLDPERPEYHRAVVWWRGPEASSSASLGAGTSWLGGPGTQPDSGMAIGSGRAGGLAAVSTGSQASSRMASTTRANALLWLPAGSGRVPFGCRVPAYLLSTPYTSEALPEAVRQGATAGAGGESVHASGCSCGREHPDVTSYVAVHPPHLAHGVGTINTTAAAAGTVGGAPVEPVAAAGGVGAGAGGGVGAGMATASKAGSSKPPAPPVPIVLGIITVSDRVASREAVDASGPTVEECVRALSLSTPKADGAGSSPPKIALLAVHKRVVPDDVQAIQAAIRELVDAQGQGQGQGQGQTQAEAEAWSRCNLVITTGGTGLGIRDVTPEATLPLLHKRCPGLVHAMLSYGLAQTPLACLSRYEAGIRIPEIGRAEDANTARQRDPQSTRPTSTPTGPSTPSGPGSLIINMPGSPKAVKECMAAIVVALPHAVALCNVL